ncbi:serine/threonine-protein kinase [Specibacter sp. NPDC078709]|uniref:serine/threonine-protein kinase n=1 Tax=Specibacter sp. NPDC078709 TaxID=3154364 RepID=UPI003434FCFA
MDSIAKPVKPQIPERPPRISGYDPVRCLGGGSQGQVWLMSAHDGSAPVAAKFLSTEAALVRGAHTSESGRHNESQITQEWRLLAQFKHEHLIPMHRLVADSNGSLVLIMEFAAGGSLSQIVRARGPLSVGEVVTILTPMGQVLAFLHGRGAIHGDVSSGNVLLSASGKPFLADFGFSRVLGQAAEQPAGTPGYFCPSDGQRNEASDVYALSAVGWFALTGRTPPPTRDRPPLSSLVPTVPGELVAALEAGLQEDPVQRPTAAAFAQAVYRSAKAESVMLAHAVHPSVLPELPTRRAVNVKRKAPSRALHGRRLRVLGRRGAGLADGEPMKSAHWFSRRRKIKSLDSLWGNAEAPPRLGIPAGTQATAAGRRAAPRRGPGTSRVSGSVRGGERDRARGQSRDRARGRAWGRAVTWVLALLGLAAAVVGVVVMNGGRLAPIADGAEVLHQGVSSAAPARELPALESNGASLPWAGALPSEIQQGLLAPEPEVAFRSLAWARSFALSHVDQGLLDHINGKGSPALAADTAIVTALSANGHGFTGLEFAVEQVHRSASASPLAGGDVDGNGTATLQATILTSSFAEQDADGLLVHNYPSEQRQELTILLIRVDSRWQIQQVLEAAPLPAEVVNER